MAGRKWERQFSPHILFRGKNYAREGKVRQISIEDGKITAIVSGSEEYEVEISVSNSDICCAYCSCPYAADENLCKHMAAVMYVVEEQKPEALLGKRNDTDSGDRVEEEEYAEGTIAAPLSELLKNADRSRLESIIRNIVSNDETLESYVRAALTKQNQTADVAGYKAAIELLFESYSDRSGYIDYYNAMRFQEALSQYLENVTDALIENKEYTTAFDISLYSYLLLGKWDIDDDGEISMLGDQCYRIWQMIVSKCSINEKTKIKECLEQNIEQGNAIDYLRENLEEFLRYELAEPEELEKEIEELERIIDSSKDKTSCTRVFSKIYGCNIEAIELRNILARKLGASENEIDEYNERYLKFRSVREHFIKKAGLANDRESEIRILLMSKALDTDSEYWLSAYSGRLVDLYHEAGNTEAEKRERKEYFLHNREAGISVFRKYKEMCTFDEWINVRSELINSRSRAEIRCNLLAEENMTAELFEEINKLDGEQKYILWDAYSKQLAAEYSKPVLESYAAYTRGIAEWARNRTAYSTLTACLYQMSKYIGGDMLVKELCREWIMKYPTRKVLVEELSDFL